MEPVISPWIIYLLGVCDCLGVAFVAIIVISGLLTAGFTVAGVVCHFDAMESEGQAREEKEEKEEKEVWRNLLFYAKTAFVFLIISSVLRVSTPSRNTLACMIVANEITEDRVSFVASKTGEAAGSVREIVKKDIVDIILATKKQAGSRNIKNHE